MKIEVRPLTDADAGAFRAIRLRSLWEHPEAFLASHDEEEKSSAEDIASRLSADPDNDFVLGAFDGGRLVGTIGFARDTLKKARHKARIWGMYVSPEARGREVGRELMAAVIARARAMPGLSRVVLSVVSDNAAARKLYIDAGFEVYGRERDALRVGARSYDEEHMELRLGADR